MAERALCDPTCITCIAFADLARFERGLEELNDDARPADCTGLYALWCDGAAEGEAEGAVWQFPAQEVAVLA